MLIKEIGKLIFPKIFLSVTETDKQTMTNLKYFTYFQKKNNPSGKN